MEVKFDEDWRAGMKHVLAVIGGWRASSVDNWLSTIEKRVAVSKRPKAAFSVLKHRGSEHLVILRIIIPAAADIGVIVSPLEAEEALFLPLNAIDRGLDAGIAAQEFREGLAKLGIPEAALKRFEQRFLT